MTILKMNEVPFIIKKLFKNFSNNFTYQFLKYLKNNLFKNFSYKMMKYFILITNNNLNEYLDGFINI